MKVAHYFNKYLQISRTVKELPSFLLTNALGDYLWMGGKVASRYQGWFFAPTDAIGEKMFKVVAGIEPQGSSEAEDIKNNFWSIETKRGALHESFFLPSLRHALVYETSAPCAIDVLFDIKDSYENTEDGRLYEISSRGKCAVITFQNQTSSLQTLYVAIKADRGAFKELREWVQKSYAFDRARNSPPYERYVFRAARIKAQKLVFAVSDNKQTAQKEADYVFRELASLKESKKLEVLKIKYVLEKALPHWSKKFVGKYKTHNSIKIASLCAYHSLSSLVVAPQGKRNALGVYAGLPWFFQFWPRDEALALKALSLLSEETALHLLWKEINEIGYDGEVKGEADAAGWILARAENCIGKKQCAKDQISTIKTHACKTIEQLLKYHTKLDLAVHNAKETWTDSVERSSSALEIQALRLRMYHLALLLSASSTERKKYKQLETALHRRVKTLYWNGGILSDSFNPFSQTPDTTIRANIFLAAYAYPRLLTKKEWARCFNNALHNLWLEWGGVASLDKNHPSFRARHSGESPQSYHQGDSWFYLNNLAAIVLYKTDKKKFAEYINKILAASTEEILFHGIAGHHAELSSSDSFSSEGCLAQAWSSALYIELASLLGYRFV